MKRKPGKLGKPRGPEPRPHSVKPEPPSPAPVLSAGRRWLFRFLALVFLPLLVFAVLEVGLRVAGYGYPTGFFQRIRAGNREILVNNETFSLRFFPPQLARYPGPISMDADKQADTYRIFILGESAARGEPEPPYSAGRYLEALLEDRFPGQKFEVVNVAITAINSHVILPIARDLARQHGDLWIIYMGNNEMVGPFGAATVFGAKAPPAGLVRLSLAIQRTRVGQLLMALARKARGKSATASSWGGMKMFLGNQLRPDEPRKQVVYQSFERNLRDIVQAGLGANAKIILNTVSVNLKDCPPFASLPNTNLSVADRSVWEKTFNDGKMAVSGSNLEVSEKFFEQAAKIDPLVPELQFRWAQCLLLQSNFPAARDHFQLACDYDALPFRADSKINNLIRRVASQYAGPNLQLFDAAQALATNSPAGISGEDLFFEHVHFTFEGNYLLGLAWAQQMVPMLPPAIRSRMTAAWATRAACETRLGLTDWNRCSVVMTVAERLHREPFTNQLDNEQRLARLNNQTAQLRHQMTRATADKARADFIAALKGASQDHWLHENYAEFLESIGDSKGAAAEWQQLRALLPQNCFAYYQVGRLLAEQGANAEAEPSLLQAVALRPSFTEAWFTLGNLYLDTGRFDLALNAYEHARKLEPQDAVYYAHAGKALAKLNRRPEAMERYRQAIALKPALAEAHFALGEELAGDNQFAAAEAEYAQVARLQPTNVLAHLYRGVMLARQGRFDPALEQFSETLRLDPANKLAEEYFDRVQGWKNQRR